MSSILVFTIPQLQIHSNPKPTKYPNLLPATATDSGQICAYLQASHHQLSLFLAHAAPPPQPQPQPQPSADSNDGDDGQMQFADEEQQVSDGAEQEDSKMTTIDAVKERMKDCFIQKNKRPKRSLSPSSFAAGERRRWLDYEIESASARIEC